MLTIAVFQAPYRLAKSVMNLTTKVTSAAFHPSGQLLAIASDEVSGSPTLSLNSTVLSSSFMTFHLRFYLHQTLVFKFIYVFRAALQKKDMLKLVHMPSGSVYMNWPKLLNIKSGTQFGINLFELFSKCFWPSLFCQPGGNPSSSSATTRTGPLHKLQTVEFSPDGTRLALGNARGRVLIYQLNHFAGYNARSHKYTPEESAQTHNGKVANAGTKKVKKPFRK